MESVLFPILRVLLIQLVLVVVECFDAGTDGCDGTGNDDAANDAAAADDAAADDDDDRIMFTSFISSH